MKEKIRGRGSFYAQLQWRLEENKKLYKEPRSFVVLDSSFGKFVASQLGVNPWKVLVPVAAAVALILRLIFGREFSDFILRVLGGTR